VGSSWRSRSRYIVSLAEQGFASILNLGLGLWLIRQVGAGQYGVFILWNNVALIASSVQNAATVCHLQALPPGEAHRADRVAPERLLLGVNTLMLVGAAGISAAAWALLRGGELAPPAAIGFVPAFLLYQYARALAFTRGAVRQASVITLAVLLASIGLFGGAWLAGIKPRAEVALTLLGIAYAMAGFASLWRLTPGLRLLIPWSELRLYRRYVHDSLWVLLGVGSTEAIARFYSFIVTAWFGPAALGALSAAQVLLRPAILAVNAWGWVARTDMAGRRQAGDWRGFVTSLSRGIVGVLFISLPWGVCVWLFWPLVSHYLYGGRFAGAGWIALLWAFSAALGGSQNALSLAFQALRAFRALAWADLAAAVAAVAVTLLLLSRLSYPYAVVGMMVGQGLEVVLLAVLLGRMIRRTPLGPDRLMAADPNPIQEGERE
jgi:putative peptidoglycan lipid II flippase